MNVFKPEEKDRILKSLEASARKIAEPKPVRFAVRFCRPGCKVPAGALGFHTGECE